MSISPWDLHVLGGLPIVGDLYEEVNPYASEITSMHDLDKAYISLSCKYLYSAYHSIIIQGETKDSKNRKVYAHEWIAFWFKEDKIYVRPPSRLRSKETWTPSGFIPRSSSWSTRDMSTFRALGVPEHLWNEVYLAAFLSCWLCVFALPSEETHMIRPSTFRVASVIASGKQICLALPVIASIYKGLNEIASSRTPGKSNFHFPAHYVCTWMAY